MEVLWSALGKHSLWWKWSATLKKIHSQGAPYDYSMSFTGCTNVHIVRSKGIQQRPNYLGHKRRSAVKFQVVSLPDGLILHTYGPPDGWSLYMYLSNRSNVEENLKAGLAFNGTQNFVDGDSAYVLRPYMKIPCQCASISAEKRTVYYWNEQSLFCGDLGTKCFYSSTSHE